MSITERFIAKLFPLKQEESHKGIFIAYKVIPKRGSPFPVLFLTNEENHFFAYYKKEGNNQLLKYAKKNFWNFPKGDYKGFRYEELERLNCSFFIYKKEIPAEKMRGGRLGSLDWIFQVSLDGQSKYFKTGLFDIRFVRVEKKIPIFRLVSTYMAL